MRDIKWGDKEPLTEKVRLEPRLETVRMMAKNTQKRAFQAERQGKSPGARVCLVCSMNSTKGDQCGCKKLVND